MGHIEKPPGEIHVFPRLVQYLAPAHAGVEGNHRDVPKMRRRGRQEQRFLRETEYRFLLAALPFQPDAGDGVRGKYPLIDRPVEEMPEALDVAVHRGFG